MQFLWTPWKKTHTKRIRVAHKDGIRSATEEIVLSYDGENYVWTLFYYRSSGGLKRTGKRHSKISSRRWKIHEIIISSIFREPLTGYTILEIEEETILEIYRFWKIYFDNQGRFKNPRLFGDVIEDPYKR